MAALPYARGDASQRELRRADLEIDDLDSIARRLPFLEARSIHEPLKVLSNAKLSPERAMRSSSARKKLAAAIAALSGAEERARSQSNRHSRNA